MVERPVWVAEVHPLKQGLKRSYSHISRIIWARCRGTSIKTRIETLAFHFISTPSSCVAEVHPLKQGLKRDDIELYCGEDGGCRGTSIKTRIETLQKPMV